MEDTRRRLLVNLPLALQKAKDVLLIEEQIEKDDLYFRNSYGQHNAMMSVNKHQPSSYTSKNFQGRTGNKTAKCNRCGKVRDDFRNCFARHLTCFKFKFKVIWRPSVDLKTW